MVEGWKAHHHLVDQDSDGPPICRSIVTLISNDLRCQVLWGPTERLCHGVLCNLLCKSKICKQKIAVFVNKNVFRLNVSVNNVLRVKMSYSKNYLDSIKFSSLFRESFFFWKKCVEFSSFDKSHDEVKLCFWLENVVHWYQERMFYFHENFLFHECWLNLIVLDQKIFSNRFHGINFAIWLLLYEIYFSKTSFT